MAAFPGGAIFLTVFAYNLIGEALRDAVDPHSRSAAKAASHAAPARPAASGATSGGVR